MLIAELIRCGELVAFPTETVYGLGANALMGESVSNIFKTKRRPLSDPLIVHVANMESAAEYVDSEVNGDWMKVASRLWPGPFTIVLK